MAGVRVRYVQEVIDAVRCGSGPAAVRWAFDKLRARLGTLPTLEGLMLLAPGDIIGLAEGEELLFGLDATLGDGSGKVLEDVATEHFGRVVGSAGLVVPGDLMSSAARLRAPLEYFFDQSPMGFDIVKSREGFSMFLGVGERPRTARLLRHVSTGAVRATQRFAREGLVEHVKIVGELLGQRVRLEVRVRSTLDPSAFAGPTPARKSSRPPTSRRAAGPHLPTTKPTLEAVDRILRHSQLPPPNPDEIVSTRSPDRKSVV